MQSGKFATESRNQPVAASRHTPMRAHWQRDQSPAGLGILQPSNAAERETAKATTDHEIRVQIFLRVSPQAIRSPSTNNANRWCMQGMDQRHWSMDRFTTASADEFVEREAETSKRKGEEKEERQTAV